MVIGFGQLVYEYSGYAMLGCWIYNVVIGHVMDNEHSITYLSTLNYRIQI